ncbi:unnamed protein product [Rotaria socialis]|uniref:RING-type domain-containing protein n=1 Tax=Rotaria socialis TaxID=392032 RepID=A0A818DND5_9BILA|nr:unnamed protein product [Rotaria socialis]
MPASPSSTSVGKGDSGKVAGPRSAGSGGGVRQRKSAAPAHSRPSAGGGASAGVWRFYTEDSPGLKVGPVPVLVMSLIFIANINGFITCSLCNGYLIDAATIPECLHTFCKTCIAAYLDNDEEDNTRCPKCDSVIDHVNPWRVLVFDRTLQSIAYKLVPHLYKEEIERQIAYYKERDLPYPPSLVEKLQEKRDEEEQQTIPANSDLHIYDDQVAICIDTKTRDIESFPRKFIICSSNATVTHLKKLLAKMIFQDPYQYRKIDIYLDDQILGKDHTMRFISLTKWRHKMPPICLTYDVSPI